MKKIILELNEVQVKYLQDVIGLATVHAAAYECPDLEKKKVYIKFSVSVLKNILQYPYQDVNELFKLILDRPLAEGVTEDMIINLLKEIMKYENGQNGIYCL